LLESKLNSIWLLVLDNKIIIGYMEDKGILLVGEKLIVDGEIVWLGQAIYYSYFRESDGHNDEKAADFLIKERKDTKRHKELFFRMWRQHDSIDIDQSYRVVNDVDWSNLFYNEDSLIHDDEF